MLKRTALATLAVAALLLSTPTLAQDHDHGARSVQRNYTPVPAQFGIAGTKDCKDDPNLKRGDKGYNHCRDHLAMQKVFNTGNCSCHTGECRATDWKYDPRSPVGLAFKIDGVYCPVNKYIDPRKVAIPDELRVEPGYVCIENDVPRDTNGCPPIEQINCSIKNDGA